MTRPAATLWHDLRAELRATDAEARTRIMAILRDLDALGELEAAENVARWLGDIDSATPLFEAM